MLLAARGFLVPGLNGIVPVAGGAHRGHRVSRAGNEPGELLDRARDDATHRPDSRVDAGHGVDGAVGDLVHLVELVIHTVHGPTKLCDDREELLLRSL